VVLIKEDTTGSIRGAEEDTPDLIVDDVVAMVKEISMLH
jgi:hypothetical protein